MKIDISKNHVICGDNLDWLNDLPDDSIDLCYIDPPFFSNRNYEVIWGNGYELRSFGDRFSGGISHYIEWMRPRVELIYKKLKQTGSLFLHCDCNASHRLRVLLDDVFKENNFRNFITWKRCDTHNDSKKQFSVISDHILFYSKSEEFRFKKQFTSHAEKTLKEWYLYLEMPDGSIRRMTKTEREKQEIPKGARRFNTDNTSSPNPRPNLMYNYKGYPHPKNGWRYSKEKMSELDRNGLLLFPGKKEGRIMLKRYLDVQQGAVVGDIWTDINFVRGNSGEIMGYKTQKPVALLQRIIDCACPERGIVLDCFGGAGTTAIASSKMGRNFVIGDVSPVAVRIMAERLNLECPGISYELKNLPNTIEGFRKINGHKFAVMVCDLMGWAVNKRKSGDTGVDAWDAKGFPIQIKNHLQSTGRPDIQKFYGALASQRKKRGVFVAWGFSKAAIEYIADVKREHGIEIIPMKCAEIINGLLIDNSKQLELEHLYNQRKPKRWNGSKTALAKAVEHKRLLEKGNEIKRKISRIHRKNATS